MFNYSPPFTILEGRYCFWARCHVGLSVMIGLIRSSVPQSDQIYSSKDQDIR